MLTEVAITLGKTIPHPTLNYASLRAEVSAKCVNTDGIDITETDALRLFVHHELDKTLQRLVDEAKVLPAVISKRGV